MEGRTAATTDEIEGVVKQTSAPLVVASVPPLSVLSNINLDVSSTIALLAAVGEAANSWTLKVVSKRH
jgi:hypothetical protein